MSFELLSEPIRKYIRDKRWEQLRPIQNAAIARILTTENHYILVSRTASGKTEAAFLPILSKVNFNDPGVQVLYISPLIALINDQFYRVEDLCKNMEVPVTKWHGEASRGAKDRLIKDPSGVVLITPESIEAMFVNRPYDVKQLFSNLKFVVIDEIHSFIGSDRGIQLKSLLSRLQEVNVKSFRVIGLSATIGDYEEAKLFSGDEANTRVLLDKTSKEVNAAFRYFKQEKAELPLELLEHLYEETKDNKVLLFPNSRGRAEEVAVKLKKISERNNGHPYYFSHHSSVDKEVREYVEDFAKNGHANFCISCTSTLELGIDIGSVDEVVQIDATHSIASLIQRVGRSGRRDGAASNLFLYATNPWSLLQSVACWLLYKEGYIEPPAICKKPYDLLLHQALSIVKGYSGLPIHELVSKLRVNFAFREIATHEIEEIIQHLIATDMLEQLQQEVIIGIKGEKIVNSRDFYIVFKTEENFRVTNSGNTIGELPFSPQLQENENILLAARIWKIVYVDIDAKKIEVIPAKDGKPPRFSGGGGIIASKIKEKMLEVLYSAEEYQFLEETAREELRILKQEFSIYAIKELQYERPMQLSDKGLMLYTFTGTKINRGIALLLELLKVKYDFDVDNDRFKVGVTKEQFSVALSSLDNAYEKIDASITATLEDNPFIPNSKWGYLLPLKYKAAVMRQKHYDVEGAMLFLKHVKPVANTG